VIYHLLVGDGLHTVIGFVVVVVVVVVDDIVVVVFPLT